MSEIRTVTAAPPTRTPTAPTVARCGGHACPPGGCNHDEPEVARLTDGTAAGPGASHIAPPVVHEALRSPGSPLPDGVRDRMQSHLAHDFSRVRVHTGDVAERAAAAVDARAFTVGRDIVVAGGEWEPDSERGQHLLAHELTHVVQQSASADTHPSVLPVTEPKDRSEHEAAHTAAELPDDGMRRR